MIRLQFKVAERAPAAAIKCDDDRAFGQQGPDIERRAMLVAQANGRRAIANLLRGAVDSRRREVRNVLIHQRLFVGRHASTPIGAIVRQLF